MPFGLMSHKCSRFGKIPLLLQPNDVWWFISGMIWRKTTSLLLTIFVCFSYCGTYFSICSIKGWPFIIEKDSFVFSTLPARFQDQIQHFYGKLQSFWLMKSKDVQNNPRDPQLWRTGRVLQCCHCSAERKERVRRTPGEKSRFSVQKGQKSSVSLQAVGKWRKTFSTCTRKQYLLCFFLLMHSAMKACSNRNRPE